MKILDFAFKLGKLKKTKRTGWIREKIPNPESVAEHSFRTAVLTMILAPQVKADTDKAVKMALIHDVGEAEIGDIVTAKGTYNLSNITAKTIAEKKAINQIFSNIDGQDYINLFDEFEKNKTKEAQLVKQVDRLEVAIQALEYEQKYKVNLQEFFDYAESKMLDKELKDIMKEIITLRVR
jgi:putative hydrolases of HD superfamily